MCSSPGGSFFTRVPEKVQKGGPVGVGEETKSLFELSSNKWLFLELSLDSESQMKEELKLIADVSGVYAANAARFKYESGEQHGS